MWSQFTNVTDGRTDGQTDRQTTCDRNTALCTKVHRAVIKTPHSLFSGDSLVLYGCVGDLKTLHSSAALHHFAPRSRSISRSYRVFLRTLSSHFSRVAVGQHIWPSHLWSSTVQWVQTTALLLCLTTVAMRICSFLPSSFPLHFSFPLVSKFSHSFFTASISLLLPLLSCFPFLNLPFSSNLSQHPILLPLVFPHLIQM